jgi:hypothetical protein
MTKGEMFQQGKKTDRFKIGGKKYRWKAIKTLEVRVKIVNQKAVPHVLM